MTMRMSYRRWTDLSYVLEEAEVHVFVLQPRQLQVAVHIRAVGVSVLQVAVVVLPVGRHRHPPVGPDTYCNKHHDKLAS